MLKCQADFTGAWEKVEVICKESDSLCEAV